mgnify:CR=1 FL=1
MNAKLTPWVIILAIAIGTIVGPLSSLGEVTTDNLQDQSYWLDFLSATIRSFASVAVAGLGLLAGAYGVPALRGNRNEDGVQ